MLSVLRFRPVLEVRQDASVGLHLTALAISIAIGIVISLALIVGSGVNISNIFEEAIVLTFLDSAGLANVMLEWGPLILVGLAASVAFSVQFWNIGIEGQVTFGAVGAAAIAISDAGPAEGRIVLMCLAAIAAGALWVAVPLFLKLRLGVNEIISTLMLNYVAGLFVLNQLFGAWQDPVDHYHHTEKFGAAERLPQIGWGQVEIGLFLALGLALAVWVLMQRSRFGAYTKFVGSNPNMALAAGIPVVLVVVAAVGLSGALSGFAGFVLSSGQEYRLTPFLTIGFGFSGIVIAFLARNNALGVIVVSFLMAGLFVSGDSLQVFYGLPAAMVGLIPGHPRDVCRRPPSSLSATAFIGVWPDDRFCRQLVSVYTGFSRFRSCSPQ